MDRKSVGAFIRAMRKEKGYTQKQLGDMISLSDRAVSRWENGIGLPDVEILVPLSKALGVTVDELLNGKKSNDVSDPASNQSRPVAQTRKMIFPRKILAICLACIMTLTFCIFSINKSEVKYTDGFFSLVKEGGVYYPYFNISKNTGFNTQINTSSILPNESYKSYELYGTQYGFAPETCAKEYNTVYDMTGDTGIKMDPVTSRFSNSRCMVFLDKNGESDGTVNVITGGSCNGGNDRLSAKFSYITSKSDKKIRDDDTPCMLKKPSVHRLKCSNGDMFYILSSEDENQILVYHYSSSNGYICTMLFDTSNVLTVDRYISSI
jgi:transcriptional regulator with XRE-family HTH domain